MPAMRRIELEEYASSPEPVALDQDQLRALTSDAHGAHIGVTPSPDDAGEYVLRASSYVGAVNVGDLAVVVRPKIPIDRVMFLIAYAMDPSNWRRGPLRVGPR